MREMRSQVLEAARVLWENAYKKCWISKSRSCEVESRARLMTVLLRDSPHLVALVAMRHVHQYKLEIFRLFIGKDSPLKGTI